MSHLISFTLFLKYDHYLNVRSFRFFKLYKKSDHFMLFFTKYWLIHIENKIQHAHPRKINPRAKIGLVCRFFSSISIKIFIQKAHLGFSHVQIQRQSFFYFLSLPLIQKPLKMYAHQNGEHVYHDFKIIYKRSQCE